MKRFKKRYFWGLFGAIVLIGFLFIVNFCFVQELTIIPKANAQAFQYNWGGVGTGGSHELAGYFPSDLKETITTCSGGCTETASTCAWDCGATFSQCGSGSGQRSGAGLLGGSYTFGICSTSTTCGNSLFGSCMSGSYTFGVCLRTEIPTSNTCSSGIFCGGGGNITLLTCGSSPYSSCGIGSYTYSTCNVGCGYIIPTTKTCNCRKEPKWQWGSEYTNSICPIATGTTCDGYCALPIPGVILYDYTGINDYTNMSNYTVSTPPAF
ncbi:MAG: hypothetical protein ACMUIU_07170 [bacterium]